MKPATVKSTKPSTKPVEAEAEGAVPEAVAVETAPTVTVEESVTEAEPTAVTKARVGQRVTVEAPRSAPPEGMEFSHWSTMPDGSGRAYKPGDRIRITNNLKLYPQYRRVAE